jgi:adenylate kinase family enzyme
MQRLAIIGNSGGGKSMLGRLLAARWDLIHFELDRFLWEPDWQLVDPGSFAGEHDRLIAGERWIIDGVGPQPTIPPRLERATDIILIDLPLWLHYALVAERQQIWAAGKLRHPPGGLQHPPSLHVLFRLMWEVDRSWMPQVRALCARHEAAGKPVTRLTSLRELQAFGNAAVPSVAGTLDA